MKAVAYRSKGSAEGLLDVEIPEPEPGPHDLLVQITAIAVNPVDFKIRSWLDPEGGHPRVLGWDAAGRVAGVGSAVSGFAVGDRVYYAGELTRQGVNAEYNVVDARIVARAPATLTDCDAAALPLTTITAWEVLFDRLEVQRAVPGAAPAVVIIGGAGGVGSMAIQLLRARTDLTVIATASRPETRDWCLALGAHHVLDHSQPLAPQIEALGLGAPGFVVSTARSDGYGEDVVALMAAQGRFAFIDDPETFDAMPFKSKSISVHTESMFTRSMMKTEDMGAQGDLLREVAALVDAGKIRTTATRTLGRISAAVLREAHEVLETGTVRGKLVLEGYTTEMKAE